MNTLLRHYWGSLLFTLVCFIAAGFYAWNAGGSVGSVAHVLWIVLVLSILEISLSFDNAVVNATVLREMDEKWQRRFLTWGILIAVFGMRIVFPLAIVAIAANLGPIDALNLSLNDPERYEAIVSSAHVGIAGFGGAFLTTAAFNSFFPQMVQGRGWICIALVVFAGWRPGKALLGAILFGAFDAYQIRLQQVMGGVIPYQFFLMLPYVLSIAALIAVSRRATYPKALMTPYLKGER